MLNGSTGLFLRWRKRATSSLRAFVARFSVRRRPSRAHLSSKELLDARRRAFLKYAAFGGALFVAGRYIDPLINTVRGDKVLSEKVFDNFKVTETGKKLLVTDDDGEEILTIDKETF